MNRHVLKVNEFKFKFISLGFALILISQVLVSTAYASKQQSSSFSVALNGLKRDYWPTEDWQVSTPSAQNMSKTRLDEMITYIKEEGFAVDSVLVVKDGYIVFEQYLNPEYNESNLHPLYSCTKSFISFFIGIAIDEGYIQSVNQKVLDFFPDQTFANLDPRKENITIKDLLTMTSGLDWHESNLSLDDPNNDLGKLMNSTNWVQYVLDRPMAANPGDVWNYNTGGFHLLSALLQNATGMRNADFVSPSGLAMGIYNANWQEDPQGIIFGGSGLKLSTRSMAKFGFLYLNNGTWDNQQLVSKDWVASSTSSYCSVDANTDYCEGWWRLPDLNTYFALGFAGQRIYVVPQYDLVVVFTSSEGTYEPYNDLLDQYVFSSIQKGADPAFNNYILILVAAVAAVILALGFAIIRRKRGKQA